MYSSDDLPTLSITAAKWFAVVVDSPYFWKSYSSEEMPAMAKKANYRNGSGVHLDGRLSLGTGSFSEVGKCFLHS